MERTRDFYRNLQNNAFGKTIAKTAVFFATECLVGSWIQKTRLPVDTGVEWDAKDMHIIVPYATLAAPVIEEAIFRGIPGVFTQKEESSWKVAIASSLAFALAHNLNTNNKGKTIFETKKLPLFQFASGLFLWHVMKKHGLKNAIASHSMINGATFALDLVDERKKRKNS